MVTYHPHCGDHVPGLSAAATLLLVMLGVVFGVSDPFPPNSNPASASVQTTAAAPTVGEFVCGKGNSADEWKYIMCNGWREGRRRELSIGTNSVV